MVYEDITDAKNACDHLNGFNLMGRYLVILYFQANRVQKKAELRAKEEELAKLKQQLKATD